MSRRRDARDARYLQRFAATNHPNVAAVPAARLERCLDLARIVAAQGYEERREIPYPLEWLNRRSFSIFLKRWERRVVPPPPPMAAYLYMYLGYPPGPPAPLWPHWHPRPLPPPPAAAAAAAVPAEIRIELTEFLNNQGRLPDAIHATRLADDNIQINFTYT